MKEENYSLNLRSQAFAASANNISCIISKYFGGISLGAITEDGTAETFVANVEESSIRRKPEDLKYGRLQFEC